jgi:hypothetical protein
MARLAYARRVSFLLDPPLLYASGRVSPNRAADAATVGAFIGIGIGFYRNARWARPFLRALPGRDGRDFMWTTGVLPLPHAKRGRRALFDKLAFAVFATYPIWLWLGTRGRR